ncbi:MULTISPECIES: CsgG/HfaB family protein [Halanaerobium]|uniref:Curli production assembly/transport component CsgG n=1 Tax=Halanaerobium kushneri TaxID=56779 RepID=A0A1N7BPB1_9FIRM|nr:MULTISPECIES: CsgG/HfaB family protein [Halanaerobium]RCW52329.1 curli production assembly/transport component CsgG [Halanaerobium sp. ST460_2HS_T2]SIR53211.1 curli production assembly/transport component CsgG [Halanaerobium kushneri]
MEEMIAVLLIVSLFAGGSTGLLPEKEVTEKLAADPNQTINEIRASADQIITSQENVTTATQLLAALPEREEKYQIAIYDIKDKTGQYSEIGSMVVSQGATEMLITALVRSRQFKVLDRVNISNFMTEQTLVDQDRTTGNDGPVTGELTGAHYVIDGAITEYQIDKKTGGLGLIIAGKGGQQEYAVASCAVDLRVTDTTTGEVVWAKSLKKEIIGERISFQVFSFMGNNIVEFESGRGKQEVINLVVRTLLEEAVYQLSVSEVL